MIILTNISICIYHQDSQSVIILTITDVGNTPPKITVRPLVGTGDGMEEVRISEDCSVGTVIAHVKIVDSDTGDNGVVDCR